MRTHRIDLAFPLCFLIFAVVFPQTVQAAPKKKKPAADPRPQLVVCVSEHSPASKALQQRLSNDPDVTPLAKQFNVKYMDVDNDPQRNAFVNQFGVRGLIEPPVLGFAAADGEPLKVIRKDLPQGDGLPQLLQEVLAKLAPKKVEKAGRELQPPAARKGTGKSRGT